MAHRIGTVPEPVEQNRGRMVSEVLPAGLDVIAGVNSARGAGGIADDDARQAAHHRRPGNTPPERAPGRGTKWTRVGGKPNNFGKMGKKVLKFP